jgi:DNA mismatch repair ATPase MutS
LPQPIIDRAKEILGRLESTSQQPESVGHPPVESAVVKKPRVRKAATAEEVNGPVSQQVELELFN